MNIIEPGVILNSNTTKLVHCKSCDATWADKKIPKVCPHCGAGKTRLAGAKEEECESFMEAYNEMLASMPEEEPEAESSDNAEASSSDDRDDQRYESYESYDEYLSAMPDAHQTNQTTPSDTSYESFEYEPIGYDPDEFVNSMIENYRVTAYVKKELLSNAEARVRDTKSMLRRAGLPTDSIQNVMQDIRSRADKLGKNIPGYTDLMLKMVVDSTLQRELAFPKKGRTYSMSDVNSMLLELGIREDYRESYYNIAGIRVA